MLKNMREELLLGTAVAPSHMYLFPLGTKYFIGTTGKVCSLKSSNYPTLLSPNASHTRHGKHFPEEKLIAQTPNCRVNFSAARFPIRIFWFTCVMESKKSIEVLDESTYLLGGRGGDSSNASGKASREYRGDLGQPFLWRSTTVQLASEKPTTNSQWPLGANRLKAESKSK